MTGTLHMLYSKSGKAFKKPKGMLVDLSFDGDNALACVPGGTQVVGILDWAKVSNITANGLFVKGIENLAVTGKKMRYQEWWFIPGKVD